MNNSVHFVGWLCNFWKILSHPSGFLLTTLCNCEFLTKLQIPCYDDGNPSLLFHNLNVCDDDEINKIFGSHKHLYVVSNCTLNPSSSHHKLHVHLQHIQIGQNSAHDGRPHIKKKNGAGYHCHRRCQKLIAVNDFISHVYGHGGFLKLHWPPILTQESWWYWTSSKEVEQLIK